MRVGQAIWTIAMRYNHEQPFFHRQFEEVFTVSKSMISFAKFARETDWAIDLSYTTFNRRHTRMKYGFIIDGFNKVGGEQF